MEKKLQTELKAFGARIKVLRKKKGFSQLDVEIESGINRVEVSKIENGMNNIEFATILKLAIALDVEIKDLFT